MRQYCRTRLTPLGLLTGQNPPKSNFLRQENLTKLPFSLENRDTYKKLSKMENKKGMALGTMMLGALATNPAVAEEPKAEVIKVATTVSQQVDCKILAKNHEGTRAEKRKVYSECKDQALDAQIAEQDKTLAEQEATLAKQQRILQALNQELANLNLQIDENARILDAQGQELARIVTINGQLAIKIENTNKEISASKERQAEMLEKAEQILQDLAAS